MFGTLAYVLVGAVLRFGAFILKLPQTAFPFLEDLQVPQIVMDTVYITFNFLGDDMGQWGLDWLHTQLTIAVVMLPVVAVKFAVSFVPGVREGYGLRD